MKAAYRAPAAPSRRAERPRRRSSRQTLARLLSALRAYVEVAERFVFEPTPEDDRVWQHAFGWFAAVAVLYFALEAVRGAVIR